MPENNPTRTLAQIENDERDERIVAINDAGLPLTTPESNASRVNNTDASSMDSQGLDDSGTARDVFNASFNEGTDDAYEAYVDDALGEVEALKQSGAGGAVAYSDERDFDTNLPSSDPNR